MKFNLFLIFLLMLTHANSFAQYQMSLQNDDMIENNQYEFDIFIKSISGTTNLTSYQIVLTFNEAISQGGDLRFEYIPGSSQLSNVPNINVGIIDDIGNQKNMTAGSSHGNDTISITKIKVGTFRLTNSIPFASFSADIGWGFNGFIRTEINLNDTNETNPSEYINLLSNSILPVELSTFSADINDNVVTLKWITQTELNNLGFEVERSSGLVPFQKIGFIKGNGTTTLPHIYTFSDKNIPTSAKLLYRIKRIDIDGEFEYSKTLEVEIIPRQYKLYQNYPNPFNPTTTIKFDLPQAAEVNLTVYNLLGGKVKTLVNGMLETGFHSIVFNANNLASGTYIYKLQASGFVQVKKMLLLK